MRRLLAWLLLGLVRFYQLGISPFLGPKCRFVPSCSSYMAEAIRKYGPWKGFRMGLKRLGRCRPGGGSGYDPVP